MAGLRVTTLGGLALVRDAAEQALPASKKTRALLAYLALTGRPQRRDRLCELLWDLPDDPRGALRWSLSKLRPVVNSPGQERLQADRERVALTGPDIVVDLTAIAAELEAADLPEQQLKALAAQLAEPCLPGLDLPNQTEFQAWLVAERAEAERLRGLAAGRLARLASVAPDQRLTWARVWLEADPFNAEAGACVIDCLNRLGRTTEARDLSQDLRGRFADAGIDWPPRGGPGLAEPQMPGQRQLLARQHIRFCTAADGARIAYATVGEGPPLVKAANWLNHLELDWEAPIWSPLFRELARDHRFIRYDERGNGLSDWQVEDLSFDSFVTDLETVVAEMALTRFPLIGISQGAAVSIAYAVRHPDRVSHLILFGGYPAGWRVLGDARVIKEREAVMVLTETGWGQDNPAYRQIFSATFLPGADAETLAWFNEFQRRTTSPANAVRFQAAFGDIDVRPLLSRVQVPTLVLHSRGDRRIPFDVGRELAMAIPGAQLVGLNSDNHLLLGDEPAAAQFVQAVRDFVDG